MSSDDSSQISDTLNKNMIISCSEPSNVLCQDVWGSGVGANFLLSPSHITRLKSGKSCELVKRS